MEMSVPHYPEVRDLPELT